MEILEKIKKLSEKNLEELFKELNFSFDGLSKKEVEKRLKIYGKNIIESYQIQFLEIFKRNFFNFFNLLLLFSILISFILERGLETFFIFLFFIFSLIVGVYQDYKSNDLLRKLLKFFKKYSLVKRNGNWEKIESEFIVPGDYIKIKSGEQVPADIRIIKAENVLVDESILTGESEPITKTEKIIKEFSNILFSGTYLLKGEAEGIVILTGKESYLGNLAKGTIEIKKETAYEKILDDFAKKITYLGFFLGILIVFLNFFKPQPIPLKEILIFIIVLIVAIVPEFLPAMTVLTLSLSTFRLSKKGGLIKRLSAIEDLGSVEILCTDKTGTITTNELKLNKIISENEKDFIKYFLLDYYFLKDLTPYEKAILEKYGLPNYDEFELIENLPFDPILRIEKLIVKEKNINQTLEIIKGAPEEIIKICFPNGNKEKLEEFEKEDKSGFRTLALALKKENDFIYLGLASFEDPLKESSFEAINLAKKLNLEIKILTGDSPFVAKKVALELGLIKENDDVILGEKLRNLEKEKLKEIIKNNKVFARVLPEDKLKIIEILQEEKFVAFLGEGINDALALKKVNVALVVDSASDITKQEADIVLLKKDLKTIVDTIYEGRKSIENIGKYIKHTMSDNFGNVFSVSLLTLYLPFVPLLPIQILLTNFLTDIPLISFANDNVETKEIKKPVKFSNRELIILLLGLGLVAGLSNILGYLLVKNESPEIIRTTIFTITTFTGLLVSYSIRTKSFFLKSKPSKSFFIFTLMGFVLAFLFLNLSYFQKIFGFVNLPPTILLKTSFILIFFILFTEVFKIYFYKKYPQSI